MEKVAKIMNIVSVSYSLSAHYACKCRRRRKMLANNKSFKLLPNDFTHEAQSAIIFPPQPLLRSKGKYLRICRKGSITCKD